MEKARMDFNPLYGIDYIALLPILMLSCFGWMCFLQGWAFMHGAILFIAIILGILMPTWAIYLLTCKISLDSYGIGKKTWFRKQYIPWEEVQTVLVYTEKGFDTVIITDEKLKKKPPTIFDQPDRYITFTNRPDVEDFIVLMMKDRLPILKQKKGFSITDLKDIADLFR